MKRFVQNMSPEEKMAWRRWRSLWFCIYAAVFVVLFGIANFLPAPRDTQVAQSASTAQTGR
jgi:hypothetical protein